jgi:hypothetical protein
MSRAHRVRTHQWRNGRLEVKDRIFESAAEAVDFANSLTEVDGAKVFDDQEQIIHDISVQPTNTYA